MRRPAAAAMGCLSVAVLGGAFHVGGRPDLPASAALEAQTTSEPASPTDDPSTTTAEVTTTEPAATSTTLTPSPSLSTTPPVTPTGTRTTAARTSPPASTRAPATRTTSGRTTAPATRPPTTPPTTPASTPPTSTTSSGTSRTVTGAKVSTGWGPVQVRLTIVGDRITASTAIKHPDGNDTSVEINDYALPLLEKQVLAAQSAQIDGVSGATVTSDGYRTSLQSALDKWHS